MPRESLQFSPHPNFKSLAPLRIETLSMTIPFHRVKHRLSFPIPQRHQPRRRPGLLLLSLCLDGFFPTLLQLKSLADSAQLIQR